jgi:hypothetical protein
MQVRQVGAMTTNKFISLIDTYSLDELEAVRATLQWVLDSPTEDEVEDMLESIEAMICSKLDDIGERL